MTLASSRREFLKRASVFSAAGAAAPWALNLAAMGQAAAANADDYKALVCVFLYGGNDYANTLVPFDGPSHALYKAQRPNIPIELDQLRALSPLTALPGGRQYALSPRMPQLHNLFGQGQMAVMLNLGTLMEPTSKLTYSNGSARLPPKLFSHNDQQSMWQSSLPEGATSGWGGRMGDLFASGGSNGNLNATFSCISVAGSAVFLSGQSAVQYQVAPTGSVALAGLAQPLFGSSACSEALRALVTAPSAHLYRAEHARVMARSISADAQLRTALPPADPSPPASSLDAQLRMVARMISARDALGAKRQVFFVSLGGFDTHDNLLSEHGDLLATVDTAMANFQQTLNTAGLADQVTTFTASDFGRTLTTDGDGSDHGWGSMHFVMGGAVKGQQFYGSAPQIANNGDNDVGQGRLLPSMGVDPFAATLGRWFGVSDSELALVLPHLDRWDASERNVGFMVG